MNSATGIDHKCTHCGEDCESELVWKEELPFCCLGCKTVYEILEEADLCEYYEIDNPNNKVKQTHFGEKYAFLDTEEIAHQLYAFKEGEDRTVIFYIPNIHCSSCIWLLENLHKLQQGIRSSQVNFVKKTARIHFNVSEVSLRSIVELLASIGYAPDINLEGAKDNSRKKVQRKLLIKMGVAGFCFGNIMLMSFPEYLAFRFKDEAFYITAFAWLNLFFSIPIVLYAGNEYFISAYKGLKHKLINIDVPISMGIAVLFFRSAYEVIGDYGPGYFDSLAGLVFFLLIGKWFQGKTYSSMSFERDYKSYFPLAVTLIENGKQRGVLVNQLKKGDHILVRNQELIPADAILSSDQAQIDYSFVTGESESVSKSKGAQIFAGGRLIGEAVKLIVQKPVSQSYLTDLWNQSAFKKETSSDYQNIVDRVSQYFTLIIILIAIVTGIVWMGIDQKIAIEAVTAVLIIACPCALALSVPFTFGNAIRIMGRHGLYLKNSMSIEHLATIDTIVFDKTGTITQSNEQQVLFHGEERLSQEDSQLVKRLVSSSNHPLSRAIQDSLSDHETSSEVAQFQEVAGMGIKGSIMGHQIKMGSIEFLDLSIEQQPGTVHLQIDGKYRGYFKVNRPKREGYLELLRGLSDSKCDLHLISGDRSGEENEWLEVFPKSNIHFEQSPQDKLTYLEQLNSKNKNTLMVGDGLNDSGALKAAKVGMVISEDVYSFSPACDAILASERFQNIGEFLAFAKRSISVVRWSFAISFVYNLIGMYFAVQGLLTPIVAAILMPLSSITIVVFVTGATNVIGRRL